MSDDRSKVLVVDDERFNINVLVDLLKPHYKMMVSKSGEQALEVCQTLKPDLILLDVMMPEMDGYEVCRRLKADEKTRDIPIIFITALSSVDDEFRGFDLGAVDYITKPINPKIVLARVKTHIILRHKTKLLEKLGSLDGLTEIPNRRRMDTVLEAEWNSALENKTPLSFVMMDVDNFKKFNDNYGHSAGDACLREIASAIKGVIRRSTDFAARYGGEEFAAILPQTDHENALVIAEKMRAAVENLHLPHEYSDAAPFVSLSLGVATIVPDSTELKQSLIESADNCLYYAKERGRNCICGEDQTVGMTTR